MVECRLGDDVHAGVDDLYDDGNPKGLLAGIHGLYATENGRWYMYDLAASLPLQFRLVMDIISGCDEAYIGEEGAAASYKDGEDAAWSPLLVGCSKVA